MLAGLFMLCCGFVLVCAYNPDITKAIAGFLYPNPASGADKNVKAEAEAGIPGAASGFGTDDNQYPSIEVSEGDMSERYSDDELLPGYFEENQSGGMEEGITSDYIPPEQFAIIIPENVSGRNGYQQIQDEQEQIDEDTARQLQERLDTGYTGDGLEFDALYYPYYAMLNEKGQHIYRQIYANGSECYQAFAPVEPVTSAELKNIFSAVYNDHPELFWMETAYSRKYGRNGLCVEIDLRFNRTYRELESANALFDENANLILSEAQTLSDNYFKEKLIHDALIDRITYNMGAEMNQSAYSALVNGQTVEDLLAEWYWNYQNKYYRQGYMENAMIELRATSCEMALGIEELQGGRYLITHELYVQ